MRELTTIQRDHSCDYKPSPVDLQPTHGGVIKIETVALVEEEVRGEEIEEDDFEEADQNQEAGSQQQQQEIQVQPKQEAEQDNGQENNIENNGVPGGQQRAIPMYIGNRGLLRCDG